jgi:insulysin
MLSLPRLRELPRRRRGLPATDSAGRRRWAVRLEQEPPKHRFSMAAAAAAAVTAMPTTPIRSPADEREYRCITLPNQMRVMLISDGKADKAAAALSVRVGHMSDPWELPGLAHFCEHMCFLGSEKHPDESEYKRYVKKCGGSTNASTSAERTSYHFSLNQEHLHGGLDIFSGFFTCPLFTESATEREVHAVDAENSKNLQNDGRRLFQLLKAAADPAHPWSKFGTGNLETLHTTPTAQGIDVRAALLKFHGQHYHGGAMTLAVLGREDLDTLQTWVTEMFAGVPSHPAKADGAEEPAGAAADADSEELEPYPQQLLGVEYKIVPTRELRTLQLLWPLPSTRPDWQHRPTSYLSHLVGHEGQGSLLSRFKALGWANSLSAGTSLSNDGFSMFSVTISLTTEGDSADHCDAMVGDVFQYLSLVAPTVASAATEQAQAQARRTFEEIYQVQKMCFDFREASQPVNAVMAGARNLHVYPEEHVLCGPEMTIAEEFEPQRVASVLSRLMPERLLLRWSSPNHEGETDQTERWYGAPFRRETIPQARIEAWQRLLEGQGDAVAVDGNGLALVPGLRLPPPNPFIPTDFTLQPPPPVPQPPAHPSLLLTAEEGAGKDTAGVTLWYKQDTQFQKPKTQAMFTLLSGRPGQSPEAKALTSLFSSLVADALNEFAYSADIAGASYSLGQGSDGLVLAVGGFSHKVPELLDAVLERAIVPLTRLRQSSEDGDVHPQQLFKEERFLKLQERKARAYRNTEKEQPYELCRYLRMQLLCVGGLYTREEMLDAINSATLEDVQDFVSRRLLSACDLEGFVFGNVDPTQAKQLAVSVQRALGPAAKRLPASEMPSHRVVMLEPGVELVYRAQHPNPDEPNSCCVSTYLLGPVEGGKAGRSCRMTLLVDLMSQPAFNQLRTQEQLGYIVWCTRMVLDGVEALSITVQSKDHSAVSACQHTVAYAHTHIHTDTCSYSCSCSCSLMMVEMAVALYLSTSLTLTNELTNQPT